MHYGLIHKELPTAVDLNNDKLPFIKEKYNLSSFTLCKNGDVAFADASEDTNDVAKAVEFLNCNGKEIVCGLHTIHGRDKNDSTIVGYKGYAFASCAFHRQIRRLAQGTKIYSINISNFAESYIGIPSRPEQAKIANLLLAIDKRIATQNKIIEDLKKLKSAIIDRCYSLRTNKILLSKLLKQCTKRNHDNLNLQVLSVSNKYGFIAQSDQFEDREVASEDTSNYKVIEKDMFAYNPARINVGSIALCETKNKGIVSPMYICFVTKSNLLSGYLKYYFISQIFKHEMNKRLEGSVRLCLTFDSLCNIAISLPDIKEQTKVSQYLTSMENKINLEEKILETYIFQRKYLLQQMFI